MSEKNIPVPEMAKKLSPLRHRLSVCITVNRKDSGAVDILSQKHPEELKCSPILFSRDVIARADKAEHIRNFLHFFKFGLIFGFHRG